MEDFFVWKSPEEGGRMLKWMFFLGVLISFAFQTERTAFEQKYWIWDDGDHENRNAINASNVHFPPDFVWGTATSAHQVEGDCDNNNWALFEKQPGRIRHNHTAGKACDHWNRYETDIGLMQDLGMNAYRLSVEWSKIEPKKGQFSKEAINHYHKVIDALLAKKITPWITLHHFTVPIWFVEKGEFEKRENIQDFVDFSKKVFEEYSGKVKNWCTINEPTVFVSMGWILGTFPPGKKDWNLAGDVLANVLEAHVQVYHLLKKLPNGPESKIGIVNNVPQFDPWTPWNPLDIFISNVLDFVFNDCVLQFFKTGKFQYRVFHVAVTRENSLAPTSNDYMGLNYYSHYHVKFSFDLDVPFRFIHSPSSLMTDFNYPIYPEGIYRAIERVSMLKLPIYITENGLADHVDDRRHLFIRRYLYAVSEAIKDGFDVRGYFYWSLLDNFEWAEGYEMRFGLYEVNFETQERRLRDGAKVLQRVIKASQKTPK